MHYAASLCCIRKHRSKNAAEITSHNSLNRTKLWEDSPSPTGSANSSTWSRSYTSSSCSRTTSPTVGGFIKPPTAGKNNLLLSPLCRPQSRIWGYCLYQIHQMRLLKWIGIPNTPSIQNTKNIISNTKNTKIPFTRSKLPHTQPNDQIHQPNQNQPTILKLD